jgi:hypothetical protein
MNANLVTQLKNSFWRLFGEDVVFKRLLALETIGSFLKTLCRPSVCFNLRHKTPSHVVLN